MTEPTTPRRAILTEGSSELDVTPREQQIVDLIGAGMSYKAVGRSLKIGPGTVGAYVNKIGARIRGNGSPKSKIIAWVITHGQ